MSAFKPVRPLGDFWRVLIAPAIWFAHFSVLYASEALICTGPPADRGTTMGWTVLLATAAASAGLVVLVAGLLRSGNTAPPTSDPGGSWFRRASLLLALLSALGIIWTTLPTAVLPACAF
ncbi:hypothetical protein [Bradyrhizobium sp.]|uniref:hypothetical protein n=1 Tax=Bradyrhizobium sp. TaxID=376 RepID=UPI0025C01D47|nr:hypothetical protein [Bradyrhizobium sp.]